MSTHPSHEVKRPLPKYLSVEEVAETPGRADGILDYN